MPMLLQIDFPYPGPFGTDLAHSARDLAMSIAEEPGLLWKIWTENAASHEAGGIYLFSDQQAAEAFLNMHSERLKQMGVAEIRAKIFDINGELSGITRAPLGT